MEDNYGKGVKEEQRVTRACECRTVQLMSGCMSSRMNADTMSVSTAVANLMHELGIAVE